MNVQLNAGGGSLLQERLLLCRLSVPPRLSKDKAQSNLNILPERLYFARLSWKLMKKQKDFAPNLIIGAMIDLPLAT